MIHIDFCFLCPILFLAKNIIWSLLSGLFFYSASLSTHLYTLFCFLSYIPIPGLTCTILKHSQVKVLPFPYLFLEGREKEASGFRGNEWNSAWGELHLCKPPLFLLGWTSAPLLQPSTSCGPFPNLDSLVFPQGTGMGGRGVGVDEEEGVWMRHEDCQ